MGVFSKLFGNAGGDNSDSGEPSFQGTSLSYKVQQCFHCNARCLGTAMMTISTLSNQGMFPGFCDFLSDCLEMLAPSLERVLHAEGGEGALKLVPDYSRHSDQEQATRSLATYFFDLGDKAFLEANAGSYQITFSTQVETLMRATKIAISSCLSLLKVAFEEGECEISSIMLDDPSYLLALADYYLLLQANLAHMQHRNSVLFIPDGYLDPDDSINRTRLRDYDYDVSASSRMAPIPQSLSLIWMPNEDGDVALGYHKLGGMPGTLYRTDDPDAQEYLDGIAYYFVKGIEY